MISREPLRRRARASFAEVCTLESLFRHKWTALFACCLGLAATAAVLFGRDRSFDSMIRVFVRLGRESVTVDPTASATGQVVALSDSQQREIQSVIDILQSRFLVERIVDDIGVDQILKYEDEFTEKQQKPPLIQEADARIRSFRTFLTKAKLADPENPRAKAIHRLEKRLKVSSEQHSNVVAIRVRSESPRLSQRIGERLLSGFQERHMEAHRATGSYGFFEEQVARIRSDLDASMAKLRDRKNEASLTSIGDQKAVLTERLKGIELGLLNSTSEFEGTTAKTADMTTTLASLPEHTFSQEVTGLTNTSRDEMRGQLYDLEVENAELMSKYTEDHPLMVKAREKLKQANGVYGKEQVSPQVTKAINAAYQQVRVAQLLGRADTAAATARIKELGDQRGQVLAEIRALNRQEIEIQDLEREIDVLDGKYRRYADNLEQARIDEALQKDRLSSINVIQPPTFSDDPVDFSNTMLAGAGLLGSILAGCGAAFGRRYLRNDLQNVADIERELELPVLATVPVSRPQRVQLN